jgi:hypothetical protein
MAPRSLNILIRHFHRSSSVRSAIIPFKLADIGEGITEVELMKWFVKVNFDLQYNLHSRLLDLIDTPYHIIGWR